MTGRRWTPGALLRAHRHLWRLANRNPFVLGIKDGSLQKAAFDRWLVQDRHFADGLFVAQARILALAPRQDRSLLLGGLEALAAELVWFEAKLKARRLGPEGAIHPVCRAYVDYLLTLAFAPYAAAIVAVWALERAYLEAWGYAKPGARPYREYVERWTSSAFAAYVRALERAAAAALREASNREAAQAEAAFVQVVLYELDFWSMTLEAHP
jgi:thiaminase/transcriptional activator TenA